jgi:hypothetical protein
LPNVHRDAGATASAAKRRAASSVNGVTKHVPPFRLDASPLTPEAQAVAGFTWADPEVGTRHRIGGEPDGLNQAAYPRCPSCRERMTFYGQLDSVGDDLVLADAGLVHVFVCFDCFEAAAKIATG